MQVLFGAKLRFMSEGDNLELGWTSLSVPRPTQKVKAESRLSAAAAPFRPSFAVAAAVIPAVFPSSSDPASQSRATLPVPVPLPADRTGEPFLEVRELKRPTPTVARKRSHVVDLAARIASLKSASKAGSVADGRREIPQPPDAAAAPATAAGTSGAAPTRPSSAHWYPRHDDGDSDGGGDERHEDVWSAAAAPAAAAVVVRDAHFDAGAAPPAALRPLHAAINGASGVTRRPALHAVLLSRQCGASLVAHLRGSTAVASGAGAGAAPVFESQRVRATAAALEAASLACAAKGAASLVSLWLTVVGHSEASAACDTRDAAGYRVLHAAVSRGDAALVELLLSRGQSVDSLTRVAGSGSGVMTAAPDAGRGAPRSAASGAGAGGSTHGSAGLPVTPIAASGWSCLHIAAAHAGCTIRTDPGPSSLASASLAARVDVLDLLLRWGADPLLRGPWGLLPLHVAASKAGQAAALADAASQRRKLSAAADTAEPSASELAATAQFEQALACLKLLVASVAAAASGSSGVVSDDDDDGDDEDSVGAGATTGVCTGTGTSSSYSASVSGTYSAPGPGPSSARVFSAAAAAADDFGLTPIIHALCAWHTTAQQLRLQGQLEGQPLVEPEARSGSSRGNALTSVIHVLCGSYTSDAADAANGDGDDDADMAGSALEAACRASETALSAVHVLVRCGATDALALLLHTASGPLRASASFTPSPSPSAGSAPATAQDPSLRLFDVLSQPDPHCSHGDTPLHAALRQGDLATARSLFQIAAGYQTKCSCEPSAAADSLPFANVVNGQGVAPLQLVAAAAIGSREDSNAGADSDSALHRVQLLLSPAGDTETRADSGDSSAGAGAGMGRLLRSKRVGHSAAAASRGAHFARLALSQQHLAPLLVLHMAVAAQAGGAAYCGCCGSYTRSSLSTCTCFSPELVGRYLQSSAGGAGIPGARSTCTCFSVDGDFESVDWPHLAVAHADADRKEPEAADDHDATEIAASKQPPGSLPARLAALLLACGADPNAFARPSVPRSTASASSFGRAALPSPHAARWQAATERGEAGAWSPLCLAVRRGRMDVAQLLLLAGAHLDDHALQALLSASGSGSGSAAATPGASGPAAALPRQWQSAEAILTHLPPSNGNTQAAASTASVVADSESLAASEGATASGGAAAASGGAGLLHLPSGPALQHWQEAQASSLCRMAARDAVIAAAVQSNPLSRASLGPPGAAGDSEPELHAGGSTGSLDAVPRLGDASAAASTATRRSTSIAAALGVESMADAALDSAPSVRSRLPLALLAGAGNDAVLTVLVSHHHHQHGDGDDGDKDRRVRAGSSSSSMIPGWRAIDAFAEAVHLHVPDSDSDSDSELVPSVGTAVVADNEGRKTSASAHEPLRLAVFSGILAASSEYFQRIALAPARTRKDGSASVPPASGVEVVLPAPSTAAALYLAAALHMGQLPDLSSSTSSLLPASAQPFTNSYAALTGDPVTSVSPALARALGSACVRMQEQEVAHAVAEAAHTEGGDEAESTAAGTVDGLRFESTASAAASNSFATVGSSVIRCTLELPLPSHLLLLLDAWSLGDAISLATVWMRALAAAASEAVRAAHAAAEARYADSHGVATPGMAQLRPDGAGTPRHAALQVASLSSATAAPTAPSRRKQRALAAASAAAVTVLDPPADMYEAEAALQALLRVLGPAAAGAVFGGPRYHHDAGHEDDHASVAAAALSVLQSVFPPQQIPVRVSLGATAGTTGSGSAGGCGAAPRRSLHMSLSKEPALSSSSPVSSLPPGLLDREIAAIHAQTDPISLALYKAALDALQEQSRSWSWGGSDVGAAEIATAIRAQLAAALNGEAAAAATRLRAISGAGAAAALKPQAPWLALADAGLTSLEQLLLAAAAPAIDDRHHGARAAAPTPPGAGASGLLGLAAAADSAVGALAAIEHRSAASANALLVRNSERRLWRMRPSPEASAAAAAYLRSLAVESHGAVSHGPALCLDLESEVEPLQLVLGLLITLLDAFKCALTVNGLRLSQLLRRVTSAAESASGSGSGSASINSRMAKGCAAAPSAAEALATAASSLSVVDGPSAATGPAGKRAPGSAAAPAEPPAVAATRLARLLRELPPHAARLRIEVLHACCDAGGGGNAITAAAAAGGAGSGVGAGSGASPAPLPAADGGVADSNSERAWEALLAHAQAARLLARVRGACDLQSLRPASASTAASASSAGLSSRKADSVPGEARGSGMGAGMPMDKAAHELSPVAVLQQWAMLAHEPSGASPFAALGFDARVMPIAGLSAVDEVVLTLPRLPAAFTWLVLPIRAPVSVGGAPSFDESFLGCAVPTLRCALAAAVGCGAEVPAFVVLPAIVVRTITDTGRQAGTGSGFATAAQSVSLDRYAKTASAVLRCLACALHGDGLALSRLLEDAQASSCSGIAAAESRFGDAAMLAPAAAAVDAALQLGVACLLDAAPRAAAHASLVCSIGQLLLPAALNNLSRIAELSMRQLPGTGGLEPGTPHPDVDVDSLIHMTALLADRLTCAAEAASLWRGGSPSTAPLVHCLSGMGRLMRLVQLRALGRSLLHLSSNRLADEAASTALPAFNTSGSGSEAATSGSPKVVAAEAPAAAAARVGVRSPSPSLSHAASASASALDRTRTVLVEQLMLVLQQLQP